MIRKRKFKKVCSKIATILGWTNLGVTAGFCDVATSNPFPLTISGRRATGAPVTDTSFLNIGKPDRTGRSLIIGRIASSDRDLNRIISRLQKQNIPISTVSAPFIFVRPGLNYVRIEALDRPLDFAKRLRRALNRNGEQVISKPSRRCHRLANIIGGDSLGLINGFCNVIKTQNKPLTILGRDATNAFNATTIVLNAGRPDKNNKSLNLGRIPVLARNTSKLVRALRKRNITIGSIITPYKTARPNLQHVNIQSVENAFVFARKIAEVIRIQKLH
ncbi:DUF1259 domain-containing protein [Longirhabdus pacifica]|uniref:DUF1259 domain-containing protein n=1 Tax=Longirhabdus pacifica TaxID=2305227 RepID=UPI001008795C|nr:DUF1259 domain-containing protein [Longirhabdus pacifica]